MQMNQLFKVSALTTAIALVGCGGDINITEGDIDNSSVVGDTTYNYGNGDSNGNPGSNPGQPGGDGPVTPITEGLATNVSSDFPSITDKPVYKLNNNIEITSDMTLTADTHWLLDGRTAVGKDNESSAVLTIEAGTTVFGQSGDDFLVVRRGSKLEATGTAEAPIVMTSAEDVTGQATTSGQWGGLVLLGNAPANSCGDQVGEATTAELQGCGVSAEGDAGQFGGNNPEDSSGTLTYLVVKHAGKTLGNGDELNGISFAGVGSGTLVDYIQVHQNLDDGIEFFGGTVNVKHVVLTEIGDDSFDWSFGWTGKAQYVYIQQTGDGDNAFESDNSEFDASATPLTKPTVSNVTIVGAEGANGVRLRAGTAGMLSNYVITGPEGYKNCLRVNGEESANNAASGELSMTHSVVACATTANNFNDQTIGAGDVDAWFNAGTGNQVMMPSALKLGINGYMPETGSPLLGAGTNPNTVDSYFDETNYIGAFDGVNNWMDGWVTVGLAD